MKEKRLFPEKGLLMLSGTAFLLLIVPAWTAGMAWCCVAAAVLCVAVGRLNVSGETIRGWVLRPGYAALSLLVNGALGVNFYHIWVGSRKMAAVAGLLGLEAGTFVPLCGVLLALAAVPAVSCVLGYYLSAGMADYRETAGRTLPSGKRGVPMGKALLILFALFVLGISAILRANFYYMDDSPRAALGYKQWDYFSRYLSTALATLVHGGDYLVDVAPLPQILAMGMMAAAGVLILYILYDRTAFSWWELAAVVCVGLNPYFLGCVSFRFDAPYMALSVLASVVPLLYRNRRPSAYILAAMLGILAVCTSYQAATGIFPMLVLLLALRMWNRGASWRETGGFVLRSVAGWGLGLLFFKLVIMIPADAIYASNALPGLKELIPNYFANLKAYYTLIRQDFKPGWLLLAGVMAFGFFLRTILTSRRNKGAAAAVTAAAVTLMGLVCFGIYPALATPVFAPRAMYGFGILLALFGVTAAEGEGHIACKAPAALLGWLFFVFSFTYGNALSVQKDYTVFRTEMVIADLQDMAVFQSGEPVTVQLSGSIGQAPVLRNMPQNYLMLNRLMPETFAGGDDLQQYGFYCYYDLRNVVWNQEVKLQERNLPVLKDTMYHTIRGDGSNVLVELK
ncbi:MAG: glucosyltransferase domain-containing protein [Firmicutes bacterium]|nr:glucosyltransferase domain-containing protein [Bacillota bacterium]